MLGMAWSPELDSMEAFQRARVASAQGQSGGRIGQNAGFRAMRLAPMRCA
jgi:hypothetical protein